MQTKSIIPSIVFLSVGLTKDQLCMVKVMNLMNPVISSGGSDETDTITDHPSGDLLGNQINVFGKAFSGKFCLIKLFLKFFG